MAVKQQFSSLEDLINHSTTPVLVCFYANWCSSSQTFSPILEQVKQRMQHQLQVIKVNADKYPQLLIRHEIKVLPTSLLFIDRELAARIRGVMKTPELIQYVQKFLV
ncbi:MAG: thiol reductase thioredoxin [Oscillatoriales cyanobacterium RM1_1_9]|nr:thiol reductase thioredoxin [Oscillatoriales cyanobacterium SM2_3_0]NJO46810.1 thiol reductase thioredoxin [Oscillatoriales cyanobacterium RM2_1_1]NJO72008.1 thiol reductase thioredoxin [Oscillatoriales cyanobacterium RM1_1_9]